MSDQFAFTCLIPARGGSKGIKHKNLQEIGGVSLVGCAVNLAISARLAIVLSTDIDELIEIYQDSDIEIRRRPAKLATDTATMDGVIFDAIERHNLEDCDIILLQPTTPFRTLEQIYAAMKLYRESKCNLLVSVTEADPSILKYYIQDDEIRPISKKKYLFSNRQDLPRVFKPNGAFYIFHGLNFLKNGFDLTNVQTFVMDAKSSLDIDTNEDLEKARTQASESLRI